MFGVGVDAGQTTIRLRHAYGQWGRFWRGQLESPFMDLDVFPNILDYWGPNGMIFFRNVQVFWQPINDKHDGSDRARATGRERRRRASYADRIELPNITPRFPCAGHLRRVPYQGDKWGYVKLAGIVRWIRWDDVPTDTLRSERRQSPGGGSA